MHAHLLSPMWQRFLQVQDAMMANSWDSNILQLPTCQLESDGDVILWNGPRVRMGICEGQPASVSPHTTSGRADYFGPLVNRAARFCFGAARGGQITMPLQFAQKIVLQWTGQELTPAEQQQPQALTQLPRVRMSAEACEGRSLPDLAHTRRKTSSLAQALQSRVRKKPAVRLSWDEGPDGASAAANPLYTSEQDAEPASRGVRASLGALRVISHRFGGRMPVRATAEQDLPSARATIDDPGMQPQQPFHDRMYASMSPADSGELPAASGAGAEGTLPRMISVAIDSSRQLSHEEECAAQHAVLLHNAEPPDDCTAAGLSGMGMRQDDLLALPSSSTASIKRPMALQQLNGLSMPHSSAGELVVAGPVTSEGSIGSFSPNRSRRPSSKDNPQLSGLGGFDMDKEVRNYHLWMSTPGL